MPGPPSEPSPSVLWGHSSFFPFSLQGRSLFSSEIKRGLPGLFYACALEEQLPCLLADARATQDLGSWGSTPRRRGQALGLGLTHVSFLAALRFLPPGLSLIAPSPPTLSLIPILTSLAFVKHLLWNKPSSQH